MGKLNFVALEYFLYWVLRGFIFFKRCRMNFLEQEAVMVALRKFSTVVNAEMSLVIHFSRPAIK